MFAVENLVFTRKKNRNGSKAVPILKILISD